MMLTLRGDWVYKGNQNPQWTVAAFNGSSGSHVRVIFDSSQSASPSTTWYRLGPDATDLAGTWVGTYTDFDIAGGSTPVNANLGGGFSWEQVPWGGGPVLCGNLFSFANSTFTNLTGIQWIQQLLLTNSTVTVPNGARGFAGYAHAGAVIDVHGNVFQTRGAENSQIFYMDGSQVKTGGIRTIHDNAFINGTFNMKSGGCAGGVDNLLIYNNYFGGGACNMVPTGTNDQYNFYKTGINTVSMSGLTNAYLNGTAPTYNYYYADITGADNVHMTAPMAGQTGTHLVMDSPDNIASDSGEAIQIMSNPAAPTTMTFRNVVVLPSKTGHGTMEIGSVFAGTTNATLVQEHITWIGGVPGIGSGFGAQQAEYGDAPAGAVASLKSNIMAVLAGNAKASYKLASGNHNFSTTDICAPANCDYNAGYNTAATDASCTGCTNQGRGYAGKWSVTPGAHDILDGQNPQFVDWTRSIALWDTNYLGNASGYPSWSSNGSYPAGDFVKNRNAGQWNGQWVGFRCINSAGCNGSAGNSEPNVGTNWRTYWEFSSLYRIRAAIQGGIRYYDGALGCTVATGGCYPAEALVRWVELGFRPQNPLYRGAGHDGTDIGAVPMLAIAPPLLAP
jgi:hypothetical protein